MSDNPLLPIAQAALRWRDARRAVDRREAKDMEELWAARLELCLAIGAWERSNSEEATHNGAVQQGALAAPEEPNG